MNKADIARRKVKHYEEAAHKYRSQAEESDNPEEVRFLLEVAQMHEDIGNRWRRNNPEAFKE